MGILHLLTNTDNCHLSAQLATVAAYMTGLKAWCYFPSLWTDKCEAQALFSVRGGRKHENQRAIFLSMLMDN